MGAYTEMGAHSTEYCTWHGEVITHSYKLTHDLWRASAIVFPQGRKDPVSVDESEVAAPNSEHCVVEDKSLLHDGLTVQMHRGCGAQAGHIHLQCGDWHQP